MIDKHCKALQYKRKIVLVTNAEGKMKSDGIDEITDKLNEDRQKIELVVMYDFVPFFNCFFLV